MITVVVADDQKLVRMGFSMTLDAAPDIEVVLLDIRMPRLDGLSALPRLARTSRVVVVTTFAEDDYVDRALEGGASGFLLKDSGADLLLAGSGRPPRATRWSAPASPSACSSVALPPIQRQPSSSPSAGRTRRSVTSSSSRSARSRPTSAASRCGSGSAIGWRSLRSCGAPATCAERSDLRRQARHHSAPRLSHPLAQPDPWPMCPPTRHADDGYVTTTTLGRRPNPRPDLPQHIARPELPHSQPGPSRTGRCTSASSRSSRSCSASASASCGGPPHSAATPPDSPCCAVLIVRVLASLAWLACFGQGPLERLWRWATWGRARS